jgi:hypothetical protein
LAISEKSQNISAEVGAGPGTNPMVASRLLAIADSSLSDSAGAKARRASSGFIGAILESWAPHFRVSKPYALSKVVSFAFHGGIQHCLEPWSTIEQGKKKRLEN